MRKLVQIGLMWLAAILLLAHQFVPHHHHSRGVESCHTEMQHEDHALSQKAHEVAQQISNCVCNHDHESQHAKCELAFETIEKQSNSNYFIAVVSVLFIQEPLHECHLSYFTDDECLIQSQFFEGIPFRGPPSFI